MSERLFVRIAEALTQKLGPEPEPWPYDQDPPNNEG